MLQPSGAVEAGIISVRVLVIEPQHFDEMNRAYAKMLSEPYPEPTTVYVRLREHMLVEIEARRADRLTADVPRPRFRQHTDDNSVLVLTEALSGATPNAGCAV